ncbi:site-specific integrase [Hoeflea sp. CAU 1731]
MTKDQECDAGSLILPTTSSHTKSGPAFRRLHSSHKAKKHWVYDQKAIRELYGVSRNTPLNWIKAGLKPIDDQKRILVSGGELNRFHHERWLNSRRPLEVGELPCYSCGCPRRCPIETVRFVEIKRGAGQLSGTCPKCLKPCYRFASARQVEEFYRSYESTTERDSHTSVAGHTPRHLCIPDLTDDIGKNPGNARIRYLLQRHLVQGLGWDTTTVDAILYGWTRFEVFSGHRDFAKLDGEQVIQFRDHLRDAISEQTGKPLSRSSVLHILGDCRICFEWLSGRKGFRGIDRDAISYFGMPRKDRKLIRNPKERRVANIADLKQVLAQMEGSSLVDRRNRAIVSVFLLTGLRINSVASVLLKLVDLECRCINADATQMRMKGDRSEKVFFVPIDALAEKYFIEWVEELRSLSFPEESALFPKTPTLQAIRNGAVPASVDFSVWKGPKQVRKVFKDAFDQAGVDYAIPHNVRKSIVAHYFSFGLTPEEILALSANLAHISLDTTIKSYAKPTDERRRHLIANLKRFENEGYTESIQQMTIADLVRKHPDLAAHIISELLKGAK